MAFQEQFANKGYMAMAKETTPGTAVTPTVFFGLYDEDLTTNLNEDEDTPIIGVKNERFQLLQGKRDHQGGFSVLAEPNTAGYLLDAILTKGNTSGGGPYTHPFTLSTSTDPNSYTVDIANGRHVHRFTGVGISELGEDYDKNKMLFKGKASALAAFHAGQVSSVSGSGPYTINLDTTYDPTATKGLVVGDIMHLYDVSADTYINFTIATIPTVASITCVANVAAGTSGDIITIRPATASATWKTPFQWARTEFRISDTAANALSATHTAVEPDSRWTLKHSFKDDAGEPRSGSFDPTVLLRTTGDIELDVNKFYDDPQEVQRFLNMTQRALVIRHFSESGYELRITINDFRIAEGGKPKHKSKEYLYHEFKLLPVYKSADSQAFDVKVLNNVSSI